MRPDRSSEAPCGLVQVIFLSWDKSARGGQGARARNRVPLAFEVATEQLRGVEGQLHVEELHWGCQNAFAAPLRHEHRRVAVADGARFRCVTVLQHPQGLVVRYRWSREDGGAPDRSFANNEPGANDLLAAAGRWVRVCANGRFTDADTGSWWYEQVTVNVAWFDGKTSGRVFVASEPVRELRILAKLW
jgi:hypothetical protein